MRYFHRSKAPLELESSLKPKPCNTLYLPSIKEYKLCSIASISLEILNILNSRLTILTLTATRHQTFKKNKMTSQANQLVNQLVIKENPETPWIPSAKKPGVSLTTIKNSVKNQESGMGQPVNVLEMDASSPENATTRIPQNLSKMISYPFDILIEISMVLESIQSIQNGDPNKFLWKGFALQIMLMENL